MKLLNIAEFKEIKFTYTETETEKYEKVLRGLKIFQMLHVKHNFKLTNGC